MAAEQPATRIVCNSRALAESGTRERTVQPKPLAIYLGAGLLIVGMAGEATFGGARKAEPPPPKQASQASVQASQASVRTVTTNWPPDAQSATVPYLDEWSTLVSPKSQPQP